MTSEEEKMNEIAVVISRNAYNIGISAEVMAEAIRRVAIHLPPVGEQEIKQIEHNQSLSHLQKWRLIREIKKAKAGTKKAK